jgi:hypothetical protein
VRLLVPKPSIDLAKTNGQCKGIQNSYNETWMPSHRHSAQPNAGPGTTKRTRGAEGVSLFLRRPLHDSYQTLGLWKKCEKHLRSKYILKCRSGQSILAKTIGQCKGIKIVIMKLVLTPAFRIAKCRARDHERHSTMLKVFPCFSLQKALTTDGYRTSGSGNSARNASVRNIYIEGENPIQSLEIVPVASKPSHSHRYYSAWNHCLLSVNITLVSMRRGS